MLNPMMSNRRTAIFYSIMAEAERVINLGLTPKIILDKTGNRDIEIYSRLLQNYVTESYDFKYSNPEYYIIRKKAHEAFRQAINRWRKEYNISLEGVNIT